MKSSGFTLVELLGTIVILSVIVIIVTLAVDSTINNSKTKLSKVQIDSIEEAAKIYYLKEGIKLHSLDDSSFEMCVNLKYLIDNDYVENDKILNLKDYNNLQGSVKIKYESENFLYKYQENSCDFEYVSLDKICSPVTEKTKTLGSIPNGDFEVGDEYICEVKPGTSYHFYILSTKDDGTVNLIMNRNICEDGTVATQDNLCTIEWINQRDYEITGGSNWLEYEDNNNFGPITAINYLNSATSEWINIKNLDITYNDEGEQFTNFKITGKARMPYFSEVNGAGCEEDGNLLCPIWMIDYLNEASPDEKKLQNPINGLYGYWMLSSSASNSVEAWIVYHESSIFCNAVYTPNSYGVRPVINVKL